MAIRRTGRIGRLARDLEEIQIGLIVDEAQSAIGELIGGKIEVVEVGVDVLVWRTCADPVFHEPDRVCSRPPEWHVGTAAPATGVSSF